jgi:hypothetical protein
MKNLHTFAEFLNESLNENAKRQGIMDKVAKALNHETKPLGHKDYLGFDSALFIVGTKEPLMISLVDDDKKLLFYKDNGDNVESIEKYDIKDLKGAVDSIEKYLKLHESVNEAASDGTYIFFYATNLTNIDYRKIFKGWEIKGVNENLSSDWVAFVKPVKSIGNAEAEIDSTIKKFPRVNSITYQSGTYSNGKFELVKGSYREYGMETVFVKTLLELIEK